VFAFGSDRRDQCRDLIAIGDVQAVGATWNGSYLVHKDSNKDGWLIYATGSNSKSQLASEPSESASHEIQAPRDSQFLGIACGSEHVLIHVRIGQASQVWGWGWNEHGNLGLGHTDDVATPTLLWSGDAQRGEAVSIWAGSGTSWIVVESQQRD